MTTTTTTGDPLQQQEEPAPLSSSSSSSPEVLNGKNNIETHIDMDNNNNGNIMNNNNNNNDDDDEEQGRTMSSPTTTTTTTIEAGGGGGGATTTLSAASSGGGDDYYDDGSSTSSSTSPVSDVRWTSTFRALVRKNVILLLSSKIQLLIVFLLPILAVTLVYVLGRVTERLIRDLENDTNDNNNDGGPITTADINNNNIILESTSTIIHETKGIQKCRWHEVYGVEYMDDCITVMFAPNDPNNVNDVQIMNNVMKSIANDANLPFFPIPTTTTYISPEIDGISDFDTLLSKSWSFDGIDGTSNHPLGGGSIFGVSSIDDVGQYLTKHPGRIESVVYFQSSIVHHNNNNNIAGNRNNNTNDTTWIGGKNETSTNSNNNSNNNNINPRTLITIRYNQSSSRLPTNNGVLLPLALERAFLLLGGNNNNNDNDNDNDNNNQIQGVNVKIRTRDLYYDNNNNNNIDNQDKEEDPETTTTTNTTTNNNTIPQQPSDTDTDDDDDEDEETLDEQIREIVSEIVSYMFAPIYVFVIVIACSMLSNHIANEKSNSLIGNLRVIGVADSAYWSSWFITVLYVIQIPSSLLSMIFAYIYDIPLITESAFLTPFLGMLSTYCVIYSLTCWGVSIATSRPFLYGIQFLLLCTCLASSFIPENPARYSQIFQYLVPGMNFQSMIRSIYRYNGRAGWNDNARVNFTHYKVKQFFDTDISGICNSTILQNDNKCEFIEIFSDAGDCWEYMDCRESPYYYGESPYNYDDDDDYCAPERCYYYPISDFFNFFIMIIQSIVFMTLAWYTLQIIPSTNGLVLYPWFILDYKYWFPNKSTTIMNTSDNNNNGNHNNNSDQRRSANEQSILIRGITKSFNSQTTAINNVDMDIPNGQVFVLLGHNGAGKTTLINMLTGKLSPTSGNAYVLGMSVKENLHGIQRMVGSVPQHDLLWNDLSAYEHVRMFATIKGVKGIGNDDDDDDPVNAIVNRVHLRDAAKQAAGGYSGGMKRRLSIALAGIGGPKVIFMDEPTTGIDPLNRRRIWSLVRELKRDRVVVLTTHLMQEADSLGDQIAILDNGTVQAHGTPLNLKTEHGTGYTLSIVTDVSKVEQVTQQTREQIPSVEVVNKAAGSISFGVPQENIAAVPNLTRKLQEEGLIREWSISQSTLEEVFLRLASQSTLMQNRQQQMLTNSPVNVTVNPAQQPPIPPNASNDGEEETHPERAEGFDNETQNTLSVDDNIASDDENNDDDNESDVFAAPGALWGLQLTALLRKAYILRRRHWIATLIQIAIPIGVVLLARQFLFLDLEVAEWQTLVYPQAVGFFSDVYNGYFYGCDGSFRWLLETELNPGTLEALTVAEAAAFGVEYPSDFYQVRTDGLLFQVSGIVASKEDVTDGREEVHAALIDSLQFYLSRARNEDEQYQADEFCQSLYDETQVGCGACSIEFLRSSTRMILVADGVDDNGDSYLKYRIDGLRETYLEQCPGYYTNECGRDAIKFMLEHNIVMNKASEFLGLSTLYIGNIEYTADVSINEENIDGYYGARNSVLGHATLRSSEDVNSCYHCDNTQGQVWVNGMNAELFSSSLEEVVNYINSTAIKEDVVALVQKNRRDLDDSAVSFASAGSGSGIDTSSCASIGSFGVDSWYGWTDLSSSDGMITNLDGTITAFPSDEFGIFDSVCNVSGSLIARYQEVFPDVGITVSTFETDAGFITLDVTWARDESECDYCLDEDSITTRKQNSMYALFCSADDTDVNGNCLADAELVCMRASPLSVCEVFYQSIPTNDDIIDITYKTLTVALGLEGQQPIIEEHSQTDVEYHSAISLGDMALFAFMFSVSIAMISPNIASVLVMEKNQRYVFAMLLNGLRIPTYWMAQYITHLITAILLIVCALALSLLLQLKIFIAQKPNYGLLLAVLLVYIHAQFGFIVLVTSIFKKERFAAVSVGFLVFSLLGIAEIIFLVSGDALQRGWPPLMSLCPMFGVFRCLLLVFWRRYYSEIGSHIGVMLGSSTLYLILGIYWQSSTGVGALYRLDCGLFSKRGGKRDQPSVAPAVGAMGDDNDELAEADVANEEQRALALNAEQTAIKIAHLGKTFPARPRPKHAVIDVTMAMDYGEIFGLLGPNGAGKTTVISMVVGQISPSRGEAFVAGFDTVLERRSALDKLGIVPQFDVYYPELTVEEHLMMYAAMKGVKNAKQSAWAKKIASMVGLASDDLFHRQASALSGGMRRRLSIAVALLSNPRVLFLDEPSTGLDPEMKRSIWNIIERMRRDRCVILTTHAMDEAEALCNRIGIMAKGTLRCVGTQEELRERYGSTYELTFTVPKGTAKHDTSLQEYLTKHCPSTKVVSNYGETRVFTVDKGDIDLSDLFELIIQGRDGTNLYTEWGINNTSLDEVFVAITAESEGVDAEEL